MADFNYMLNQWEDNIKAKIRMVDWLRSLQPVDFVVLLRRVVKEALRSFEHDRERYDQTLLAVQREFEDLNGIDWHLKREVYDLLAKRAKNADVTIGFRKDDEHPEGRYFVGCDVMYFGVTLIEAAYQSKKAWEK